MDCEYGGRTVETANYEKIMKYEKKMKSKYTPDNIEITVARVVTKKPFLELKTAVIAVAVFIVLLVTVLIIIEQKNPAGRLIVMNTDKTVYPPNEMVKILISSIDKDGNTLCHSNLKITVEGPGKYKTELSTENGAITTSTTCAEDGSKTNNPDYQTSFVPKTEGTYKLLLSNLDTKETVKNKIKMKFNQDFIIERLTTTRVNPSDTERYHMVLRITPKNDFKGQVTEIYPSSIVIVWKGEARKENGKLSWDVDIKAGETREIVYDYQITEAKHQTYDFGPVAVLSGGRKVFEDGASWQVLESKKLEKTTLLLHSPLLVFLTENKLP